MIDNFEIVYDEETGCWTESVALLSVLKPVVAEVEE